MPHPSAAQEPFTFLDVIPSAKAAVAINANRYANTLFKGGRFDVKAGTTGRAARRARRMGAFIGNDPAAAPFDPAMYIRGKRMGGFFKDSPPFVRQSAAANNPFRSGFRFGTVSSLTGNQSAGYYTPFQFIPGVANAAIGRIMGSTAQSGPAFIARSFLESAIGPGTTMTNAAGETVKRNFYSGGFLGRVTAMGRSADLDARIVRETDPVKKMRLQGERARLRTNTTRVGTVSGGRN